MDLVLSVRLLGGGQGLFMEEALTLHNLIFGPSGL